MGERSDRYERPERREGRPMRGVGYAPRGGGFRPKGPRVAPKKKKKVRVYFHQALTRILLPKLLTKAKYLSPALARQFIEAGRVRVNARIVSSRYYEVNLRKERVTIDEAPTEFPRRLSYMIYNKPRGVLCEKGDPAFDAIFEPTCTWAYPFGRLSRSVSGLVILSNDPRMATRQHLTDVELQKEYRIRINKHLTDEQLDELRHGILVGDDYLVPLKVNVGNRNTNSMWLDVTLLDDSYHAIYTALKALGAEVVKMRRMRIGLLNENMVPPGEWRELSGFEITALDLNRFMPGELPPEPLPPPRPRLEKGGKPGGGRFSKDPRGGRKPGWGPPGKKGFPPGRRREEDPDDREERLRQEALADAIGNR
jgi:pseudouridine synthase